ERLTLKHLGGSKAMKRKLLYGKYDPNIRDQMEEMRQRGKALIDDKISGKGLLINNKLIDEEFESSESEIEIENEENDLEEVSKSTEEISSKGFDISIPLDSKKKTINSTNMNNNIVEAFASDDVVALFEKEKEAEIEKDLEKLKDQDNYLQGWGSWSGPGIAEDQKKKEKFIKKTPMAAKTRKDKHFKNVIINEDANRPIKNLQVSRLPHNYKNVKDFQNSISAPIGPEWNTPTSFEHLIRPKIEVINGSNITPLRSSDVFKSKVSFK
ncbi:MAG: U3 small nucleolar RNA-associated protein 14 A, partial [Paramarteilia canceri]